MYKKILLLLIIVSMSTLTYAQRASVSTDVLKWCTLSPNLSADIILSSKLSLNVEGSINPFDEFVGNLGLKHASISSEFRYWFKRPLYSHYVGVNVLASVYDVKYGSERLKEQVVAIGVGYGYSFIVNEHLSLTPHIGVGYGYFSSYTDPELNEKSKMKTSFRPTVTQIGISLSYIIN